LKITGKGTKPQSSEIIWDENGDYDIIQTDVGEQIESGTKVYAEHGIWGSSVAKYRHAKFTINPHDYSMIVLDNMRKELILISKKEDGVLTRGNIHLMTVIKLDETSNVPRRKTILCYDEISRITPKVKRLLKGGKGVFVRKTYDGTTVKLVTKIEVAGHKRYPTGYRETGLQFFPVKKFRVDQPLAILKIDWE